MTYNAAFNVSSSVSLIQSAEQTAMTPEADDNKGALNQPVVKADDNRTTILSALPFISSLGSAHNTKSQKAALADTHKKCLPDEGTQGSVRENYSTFEGEHCRGDFGGPDGPTAAVVSGTELSKVEEEPGSEKPSKFTDRFACCRLRRDLLPVKLFYFAFVGALGLIFPYCAVFLKQLGLSAFQIGIISGVRPALGFVSAPIWGCLADRFNLRRAMMMASMLAWLAFFLGLYLINAPSRLRTPFPDQPTLYRGHVRFRRGADGADATSSSSGNLSTCNYSYLSEEDKELLQENLFWIYDPDELYVTFIVCILIICGGELFQAPTTAMTDAATLQLLGREDLRHYGAQRAWGPIGWAISSLFIGAVLNAKRWHEMICGIDLTFTDYRVISYSFVVVMVFGLIAGYYIDFSSSKDSESNGKVLSHKAHDTLAVFKLFLNVHYGSWILTTFYAGLLNGVIWGFLFWHLDNLGGTQLLMGIDSVVMCIFEFASFYVVDHVIRLIGHMGIMYVGLIGYCVRLLIYASLSNPWFVLPADMLQGVTFSFIWVSLTAYTAVAVPCVSLGTVQGIVHGVYFGLGNGLGHLIGGVLIGYYGAVATFYGMAASTVAWLLFFVLCQKLSKKPNFEQFCYEENSGPNTAPSENQSETKQQTD